MKISKYFISLSSVIGVLSATSLVVSCSSFDNGKTKQNKDMVEKSKAMQSSIIKISGDIRDFFQPSYKDSLFGNYIEYDEKTGDLISEWNKDKGHYETLNQKITDLENHLDLAQSIVVPKLQENHLNSAKKLVKEIVEKTYVLKNEKTKLLFEVNNYVTTLKNQINNIYIPTILDENSLTNTHLNDINKFKTDSKSLNTTGDLAYDLSEMKRAVDALVKSNEDFTKNKEVQLKDNQAKLDYFTKTADNIEADFTKFKIDHKDRLTVDTGAIPTTINPTTLTTKINNEYAKLKIGLSMADYRSIINNMNDIYKKLQVVPSNVLINNSFLEHWDDIQDSIKICKTYAETKPIDLEKYDNNNYSNDFEVKKHELEVAIKTFESHKDFTLEKYTNEEGIRRSMEDEIQKVLTGKIMLASVVRNINWIFSTYLVDENNQEITKAKIKNLNLPDFVINGGTWLRRSPESIQKEVASIEKDFNSNKAKALLTTDYHELGQLWLNLKSLIEEINQLKLSISNFNQLINEAIK